MTRGMENHMFCLDPLNIPLGPEHESVDMAFLLMMLNEEERHEEALRKEFDTKCRNAEDM